MRLTLALLLLVATIAPRSAQAVRFELFAKGSASKNFIDVDKSITSVTISSGMGVGLFSWLRLEGRYTNISSLQNKLDVQSSTLIGTISDMKTQTGIFSLGLDITFTTEKSPVQPFIYLGGGYIETERSYYFTDAISSATVFVTEPKKRGVSINGGAGIRVRLTKQLALELEAFGYAMDIQTDNPLINLYGTAGVRLYL